MVNSLQMTNQIQRLPKKWEVCINKKVIEIILLLIPFFQPRYIDSMFENGILDTIFKCWRVLGFLYMAFLTFRNSKKLNLNLLIPVSFYQLFILLSLVINHHSIIGRAANIINCLGTLMIYIYFSEFYPLELIKANFGLLSFLVIVNGILTIFFPNGLNHATSEINRINFLGLDNMLSLIILLTIYFCSLYIEVYGRSVQAVLTIFISLGSQLFYFSGSGVVSTIVIVAYIFLFMNNKMIIKMITPTTVFALFLAFEIILVFVQNIEAFAFICNWLNKSSTFTDRIYIWRQGLMQFKQMPLFGSGSGSVYLWSNPYAHNAILDILLKGGLIGLVSWMIMIMIPFYKYHREKNYKWSAYTLVTLFSFLLIGLMEGLEDRIGFIAFISLSYVLPKLNQVIEKNKI